MLAGLISTVPPTVIAMTWDPLTASNVTLSGGNLVVTNTGGTSTNQGARVSSQFAREAGKLYFEVKMFVGGNLGEQVGVGVGATGSTYADMGLNALNGAMALNNPGGSFYECFESGSDFGTSLSWTGDSYVCARVAVNLDTKKVWIAECTRFTTLWNGQGIGASNPVTNLGGLTIPAGLMVPMVTFGGASGVNGITFRLNMGATWFYVGPPSGFTAWGAS